MAILSLTQPIRKVSGPVSCESWRQHFVVNALECEQVLRVLVTFGGKAQQVSGDKEAKLKRSQLHSTSLLASTAVPPKVRMTRFCGSPASPGQS